MVHWKEKITRRKVAAAVLCLAALLLLLRIADMTVIRPAWYRARIAEAIAQAEQNEQVSAP